MGNICCFAGHRDIFVTDTLYNDLLAEIEKLITEENVETFPMMKLLLQICH